MKEQLNIGLLGMGVVGTGVCQLLAEQKRGNRSPNWCRDFYYESIGPPYDDKSA